MQYEKPMGRKAVKQVKKDKNVDSSNSQSRIANSMEAMAEQALNWNVSRATFYEDHSKMQRFNWELNIMNKDISTLSPRRAKYFWLKQDEILASLDAPKAPHDNPNSNNSNRDYTQPCIYS
ncbi:No apical meristem-associated [Abeliophyllum distichum]|uniref:No apical meristem-associated n=1 Tax=Abeliophyllum distichum TaxID=126358 RepID=A0ABD1UKG3_9LAMI